MVGSRAGAGKVQDVRVGAWGGIMQVFSVPPTEETSSEPNFYDAISKIHLR